MRRAIRAERIKLISLRSNATLLGGGLFAEALYARLVPSLAARDDLDAAGGARGVISGSGLLFTLVLVLGILVSSSDLRHHTANWTFVAEPRRVPVFIAKLVVAGTAGLLAGLAFVGVNAGLGLPALDARGVTVPATEDLISAYAGSVVAMVLAALLGVGTGFAVRQQVTAIVVAVGVFFVLAGAGALLGSTARFMPAQAVQALQGGTGKEDLLSQGSAGLLFAGYAVAVLGAGMARLRRRDIVDG